MRKFILIVITLASLKASRCDTACGYLGYDKGFYQEEDDTCLCADVKPYEETVNKKRIVLPKKPSPPKPMTAPLFTNW